jgi:hypothetical protein
MIARERARVLLAAVGSALLCALLRLPNLPQPTGPDQGIMMRMGMGLLRGHVPYRDGFEAGSPPIFFTYAAFLRLLGERMLSVNLADLIVVALTALFVAGLAARAVPSRPAAAAWCAGLLFAVFSAGTCFGLNSSGDLTTGSFWFVAQRETFINLLAACALWFALGAARRETRPGGFPGASVGAALFVGLLSGAGFYYKYPALALFLPATLLVGLPRPGAGSGEGIARGTGVRALAWLAGFLAVPGAFLWWFDRHGALAPMLEATVEYVHEVYGRNEYGLVAAVKNGFLRTVLIVRENASLWVLCVAGTAATAAGLWRGRSAGGGEPELSASEVRADRLLVAWWLLAIIAVCSQREFFGYHFLVLLPPLAALAGVTLARMLPNPETRGGRRLAAWALSTPALLLALLFAGNALVFAGLNSRHFTRAVRMATGDKTREWYDAQFTAWPGHEYSYPADAAVAARVREITREDDRIFVLGGIEPVIYTLSGRRSASRFIWSWCLTDTARADGPISARFRSELISELLARPPAALVTIGPLERFRKYPELTGLLEPAYELDTALPEDRYVYRPRPGAALKDQVGGLVQPGPLTAGSDPW